MRNPFVVPGVAMHQELRNFVECGFTPEQAWEAATREKGESCASLLAFTAYGIRWGAQLIARPVTWACLHCF